MGFVHDCLATDLVPATSVVEQVFAAGTPTGMQAQAEPMQAQSAPMRLLTQGKKYIATRDTSAGLRVYVEFFATTGDTGDSSTTNTVFITECAHEPYRKILTEEDPLQDRVEKVQFLGRRFFVNDRMPFTQTTEFDLYEQVA